MTAQSETPLTAFQIMALRGERGQFDGWTKRDQVSAILDLVQRGLMTAEERGSDEAQYTYVHVEITAAGRAVLADTETRE